MLEITKKFCDSFLDYGISGFDLAVFKDGKSILRHMNGYSDLENKIPMNGKERYNIYSCSKPITCTAALQLFEKGLFSLEDKLCDYMPEFTEMTVRTEEGIQKAKKPILIKHLFEMTAGFSYDVYSPQMKKAIEDTDGRCPTREVMKYLAKEPLLFEPGDRWEYSLCHDVLAAFVEVVSGERFEEYVRKNIFEPLGMTSSTFVLPDNERESLACQYQFDNEKKCAVNHGKGNWYMIGSEYASGGAGCVSTVDDYIKFLEGLRTYKLLKKETVDLMQTDRLTIEQKRTFAEAPSYGYGLGVRCPKNDNIRSEFGWGGAAGAYLAVSTKTGISIYFGIHLLSSPVQLIRGKIYELVCAELFDKNKIEDIKEYIKEMGFTDYKLTY